MAVIEKWLFGYPRNDIALQCQISVGAVSSIVDEWSHSVGLDLANLLRGLAVTLRKLGMSPAQCAIGLRIVNLIDKMDLDVNSIETFLSEIYARLQELDVNPKYIARYMEGLISLADGVDLDHGRSRATSIQRIDEIFEKRRQYNLKLEEEFKFRESRLAEINEQLNQSEIKLEKSLEKNRILEQDTEWKSELRDELQKYGLDASNIPQLVGFARFFNDNKYSLNEMLTTFSSYKNMLRANIALISERDGLKNTTLQIQQQYLAEESKLQQHKLKNNELDVLMSMGFGLGELKTLHNIVVESASENGQSVDNGAAVKNFVSDIENHHYDYIRLRTRVEELKSAQTMITLFNVGASNLGEAARAFLRKKGITQDDIMNIIRIMEIYEPGCISKSDPEVVADGTKKNPVAQDRFIQPFEQYKPSKPIGDHGVAHKPKDSELVEPGLIKSNPEEIEWDIMEMTRCPQQMKNCDTVLADVVKMDIPNLSVEDKKYQKIGKPRYPRPTRVPKRGRPVGTPSNTDIIDTTDGQIRISLVTPTGSPGVLIPQYTWLKNSVSVAKDSS